MDTLGSPNITKTLANRLLLGTAAPAKELQMMELVHVQGHCQTPSYRKPLPKALTCTQHALCAQTMLSLQRQPSHSES